MDSTDYVWILATIVTTVAVGIIILYIVDKRFKGLIPFIDNFNAPSLSGVTKGTKFRKTMDKSGKEVRVSEGNYLYLGRTVNDRGPVGYSHVSEIRDTLVVMKKEHNKGIIDSRTLNARQMTLKGIVEQSKEGEFEQKGKKISAIREINQQRKTLGWKTLSYDLKPERPTKAQKEASKVNIETANQKRIKDAQERQAKKIEEQNIKTRRK